LNPASSIEEKVMFSLLTHDKSKYYNKSRHANFESLLTIVKSKLGNVNNTNSFSLSDVSRFDIYNQFYEIFRMTISMLKIRIILLRSSPVSFYFENFKHLIIILKVTTELVLNNFISLLNVDLGGSICRKILRQSNISSGHLALMCSPLNNNKKYSIILEDDFYIEDFSKLISILEFVVSTMEINENLMVVNLSKSFTFQEMGIKNFTNKSIHFLADSDYKLDILNYPITNTVCATIYRVDFLKILVDELSLLTPKSLIPIDHKINIALSNLIKKKVVSSDCYGSLEPGIFVQGSLHG